ncbi:SSU ribosomal protein S3P [Candidatus Kryptonium thompsonii]|uniref:Small ribosomal subunit protein uS3 n=1 Tax=Candidatus Kryptonium thompsonii TaxID=1633631 RepID=A0A0P1LNS6_9BACT|nr:30S ribosomal protein S3 [Candidatus Kryptonium thompsoni]CUS76764.1 SSU ribosomal protein S3P [Candidatus Kryptonium thompsoni]CUS77735.1 SSU ribosomal protein S3P [Candidatus Kryptonium thompsoni]CUS81454.1 SSU ribosomal protein S3P [Candidatus Kryptonium thompsoni]CUS83410.1 SSU ribosomal protein S3P [Candidatus Kryptonium thompsoni]CUS88748.1 SSU ribosomal protein S3P [Candidatus Kryptonium thompsoni]
MGQKTHPIGFRLGIIRDWDARWYDDKNFAEKLQEDLMIRNYLRSRLKRSGVSRIIIDRKTRQVEIKIHTSRPGMVIGKGGKDIELLQEELKRLTNKEVKIEVVEIKRPELDAYLVAESIAAQIENRVSYRRAMKAAVIAAMRMGAQGIKVMCSGRLAGAEIARSEWYLEGRVPLHTIRADIDFAIAEALTIYGKIGVKVWIFKGEVIGRKPQLR